MKNQHLLQHSFGAFRLAAIEIEGIFRMLKHPEKHQAAMCRLDDTQCNNIVTFTFKYLRQCLLWRCQLAWHPTSVPATPISMPRWNFYCAVSVRFVEWRNYDSFSENFISILTPMRLVAPSTMNLSHFWRANGGSARWDTITVRLSILQGGFIQLVMSFSNYPVGARWLWAQPSRDFMVICI